MTSCHNQKQHLYQEPSELFLITAQAVVIEPFSKMGKLRLRKTKVRVTEVGSIQSPNVSVSDSQAYPFSVGDSPLAHVNVPFFTVMLFIPPPRKHQKQYVRNHAWQQMSCSGLLQRPRTLTGYSVLKVTLLDLRLEVEGEKELYPHVNLSPPR